MFLWPIASYRVGLILSTVQLVAVIKDVLVGRVEAGFDTVLHNLTGSGRRLELLDLYTQQTIGDNRLPRHLTSSLSGIKTIMSEYVHCCGCRSHISTRNCVKAGTVPSSWRRWYWWGGPLWISGPAASQDCWQESCSAIRLFYSEDMGTMRPCNTIPSVISDSLSARGRASYMSCHCN